MSASAAAHSLPAVRVSLPDLSGLRVLVVEDGLDNQRLLKHYLHKAGAQVVVVENGRLAVDAVFPPETDVDGTGTGPRFDIVLMDLQMPVLDGESAARELRALGCSLPIVALTAHPLVEIRTRCLAAGFTGFALKPFDRTQLLQTIDTLARPQANAPRSDRNPHPDNHPAP
jgi:CheY-like chemotaxis protein